MDIIIIARDTWGETWRRRQFLAAEFAREHKVLFVEAPYSLPLLLKRSPDITRRPQDRLLHAFKPPQEVQENIFITAPPKPLPNHPHMFATINRKVFTAHLKRCMEKLEITKPVLWITPEHTWWFPRTIEHSVVIYDITDDWVHATSLSQREATEIKNNDRLMTARADIVFTVSHDLHQKKKDHHTNVVYMPNGVRPDIYDNAEVYRPPELQGIEHPIAGYTGSLHTDRLDMDLIQFISSNSDIYQVFIGPDYLDAKSRSALKTMDRVLLIPSQPPERLGVYVNCFDVCHIPHLLNDFTHSLDPIKAYEYLASGKPIVSVTLRGLAHLDDFIDTQSEYQAYCDALIKAIDGQAKSDPESRRAKGRENSWSERANQILKHIQEYIPNN